MSRQFVVGLAVGIVAGALIAAVAQITVVLAMTR